MAWEDYFAVINADVYDLEGLLKPILSRIAFLMIGPPKEGEEADPDVGWCVAGQPYIAANLGCSRTAVNRAVKRFTTDRWLRGRYAKCPSGDPILHLHWTDDALKRLEALRFKKDGRGKLVRSGHRPSKRNKNSTFQKLGGEKLMGGLPAVEQRVASGHRREVTNVGGEELTDSAARSLELGGEVPFEGVAAGFAVGLQKDKYMQAQPSAERSKPTATPSKGLRPSETPAQDRPAARVGNSQSKPKLVSPKPREERGHIFEWLSGALSGCNYCSIPFPDFVQGGRPRCRGKQSASVRHTLPRELPEEQDLVTATGHSFKYASTTEWDSSPTSCRRCGMSYDEYLDARKPNCEATHAL